MIKKNSAIDNSKFTDDLKWAFNFDDPRWGTEWPEAQWEKDFINTIKRIKFTECEFIIPENAINPEYEYTELNLKLTLDDKPYTIHSKFNKEEDEYTETFSEENNELRDIFDTGEYITTIISLLYDQC